MSEVDDSRMERLKTRINGLANSTETATPLNQVLNQLKAPQNPQLTRAIDTVLQRTAALPAQPATPISPEQRSANYNRAIREANQNTVISTPRGDVPVRGITERGMVNDKGEYEVHQYNQLGVDITQAKQEERAIRQQEIADYQARKEAHPVRAKATAAALATMVGGLMVIGNTESASAQVPPTPIAGSITPGPTETPVVQHDRLKSPVNAPLEVPQPSELTQVSPGVFIYKQYPSIGGPEGDLDPQIGLPVDLNFFKTINPTLYNQLKAAGYQDGFPTLFAVQLQSGKLDVMFPYEKDMFNEQGARLLAAVGAIQLGKIQFGSGPQDFFVLRPDQHQALINKVVSGEGGANTVTWSNLLFKADGSNQNIIDANGAVDANGNNKLQQTMGARVVLPGTGGKDIQIKDVDSVINQLNLNIPADKLAAYHIDPQTNLPDAQKSNWVVRGVHQLMPKVMYDKLLAMNSGDPSAVEQNIGNPVMPFVWVVTKVNGVDTLIGVQLCEYKAVTYNPLNGATSQVELGQLQRDIVQTLALPVSVETPTPPPVTSTPVPQESPSAVPTKEPGHRIENPVPSETWLHAITIDENLNLNDPAAITDGLLEWYASQKGISVDAARTQVRSGNGLFSGMTRIQDTGSRTRTLNTSVVSPVTEDHTINEIQIGVNQEGVNGNRIYISGHMLTVGFVGNKMIVNIDSDYMAGRSNAQYARSYGGQIDLIFEALAQVKNFHFPDSDDPSQNFLVSVTQIYGSGTGAKTERDRLFAAFSHK